MTRRIGIIFCFSAIVALSVAPYSVKRALGTLGAMHGPGHILAFGASAAFLIHGCTRTSDRAIRLLGVFLFAIAMEFLETVIYRNLFEWSDLFIDCCGIALAPLLILAWNAANQVADERS